jgi:luciferase family oxidoreductase group 1
VRISVLDHSPVAEGASAAQALHNSVELARCADAWGYHRFWLAEHHALASHAGPAPEIMIARLASVTTRIRVGSGGVLLALHNPMKVAEVFRTLHALFPGRVDLGIGRSFGALPDEVRALGRDPERPPSEEEFDRLLTELRGFLGAGFPAGHPYADIPIMPEVDGAPPVWLLGSSPASGVMAGRHGLPYTYAQFIDATRARAAFDAYRAAFVPGAAVAPECILGVGVYCAETEAQARALYSSHQLLRHRLAQHIVAPVPSPERAAAELPPDLSPSEDTPWPRCTVGTPDQVRAELLAMATALGVEEVVVMSFIADHAARMRSYELLAQAFGRG